MVYGENIDGSALITCIRQYERAITSGQNSGTLENYQSSCIEHVGLERRMSNGDSTETNENQLSSKVFKVFLPREFTSIKDFSKVLQLLDPKAIEPSNDSCRKHLDHSLLFQLKSLESLSFNYIEHVEPIAVASLNNQDTKLKSLSITMFFHQIIKDMNDTSSNGSNRGSNRGRSACGCYSNILGNLLYSDTIIQDWNVMIQVLSDNKTIQHLQLLSECRDQICYFNKNQDSTYISSTFKSLFTNNSTITSLSLHYLDFINTTILDGIANSKSIKSLEIFITPIQRSFEDIKIIDSTVHIYSYLFNNVLSTNSTIQNITINWGSSKSINKLYNLLNQSKSHINLQSLSVIFIFGNNKTSILNNIVKKLQSLSLPIIEINLKEDLNNSIKNIYKIVLNNKILLNNRLI